MFVALRWRSSPLCGSSSGCRGGKSPAIKESDHDTQQLKVDVIFDKLMRTYGANGAAVIHKALLNGAITQEIRRKVRRVCLVH